MTRHSFIAFGGARCEISAPGAPDADVSAAVAEVYAFEARLTRFSASSELMRFNAAAGERVAVSPLLNEVLLAALEAHELSDGLVNAATHNALARTGYDRTFSAVRTRQIMAVEAETANPVPALPEVLEVGEGWARLTRGHAIDLGGVGKGWLADRLGERFDNAVVNLGGDLRARGDGPEGAGWTVGLCDGSRITIREGGVATSGTARRRWPGGHHLIDPRTGACAETDVSAVSVAAADAAVAETLAKGAAVLGSSAAATWLPSRGALRYAIVADGPAALADEATAQ